MQKLNIQESGEPQLNPREKLVVGFIQYHPGCKSGEIIKGTGISRMIVIRQLTVQIQKNIIERHGTDSGTQYSIL